MASGNAEVAAAEAKVEAAKQEVAAAKQEVAAAEAKVAAAKQEVAAAKQEVAAAKQEVAAAEAKVEAAKREVEAAEAKVETAKLEYRAVPDDDPDKEMLRDDWKMARKGLDSARKGLDSARKGLDSARKGSDGAQKGLDGAEDGLKIARKGLDGAQDLLLRLQRATDAGTRATDCSVPVPRPGSHFSFLDVVFRVCPFFIRRYRVCPGVDVVAGLGSRTVAPSLNVCCALPCCRASCMALRAVCETACTHDSPPLVCVGALVMPGRGVSWPIVVASWLLASDVGLPRCSWFVTSPVGPVVGACKAACLAWWAC